MNNDKYRIELIVIDLVERMTLPQDVRIKRRDGTMLYTGSVTRIPKELLNEKVTYIYPNYYGVHICIVIE